MSSGFSYAQLKAALWADPAARVHAVIDGLVVPGLPKRLQAAELAGWDCLQRGALTPQAADEAAYLAEIGAEGEFSDWLLQEATTAFAGWGVLLVSGQPLLPMREHCRGLADVLTPDGERRTWRWYDPEVLSAMLPLFTPAQLDEVFAAGQSLVIPTPQAWTWHALEQGVLASQTRTLMVPAS